MIKPGEAARFYSALFGDTGDIETEIRLIHPDENKYPISFWGSLEKPEYRDAVVGYNDDGYNVYMIVNQPDQAVGRKRVLEDKKALKDEHIRKINALFVELDRDEDEVGENLERLQEAELPPTFIIQSSAEHKLHAYWIVDDCPVELFKPLQAQLINYFQGDQACKNPARVMRVPSFYNTKREPLPVFIVEDNDVTYTLAELCAAFKLDPDFALYSEKPIELPEGWEPKPGIEGRILKAAESQAKTADVKGRHQALKWFALSCLENRLGQSTAEELAVRFVEMLPARPDGRKVPLSEAKEVISWTYENAQPGAPWDDEPKQKFTTDLVEAVYGTIDDEGEESESEIVGSPIEAKITVRNFGYALKQEKKTESGTVIEYKQVTNWTFVPNMLLIASSGALGERGILTVNGKVAKADLELQGDAWSGRREILKEVGKYQAAVFTNSAADVAQIRQYINLRYGDLPVARGVSSYGLHKGLEGNDYHLLYENGYIGPADISPIFYDGVPVDSGSKAYAKPKRGSDAELSTAKQSLIGLMDLITREAALGMLGYALASAFAPRFVDDLGGRMPFLYGTGERESGKTSAVQIILNATTGNTSARLFKASGMSAYQYDIAFSNMNNYLAVLDEYRPGEIDEAQLRKHHDLGTKWRGQGMAKKDLAYRLASPMIVLGEGFAEDAAALSRGVLYYIKKSDRGDTKAYNSINKMPNQAYAYHLQETARSEPQEKIKDRFVRAKALIKSVMPKGGSPRLEYGVTFIAFGLLFAQEDLDANVFNDTAILSCIKEGIDNTTGGGVESKTNFESFLEQLGHALVNSNAPESVVQPAPPPIDDPYGHYLIFAISGAVALVKERFKTTAAISNSQNVRKFAEDQDYANTSPSHRTLVGNKVMRGIKIALDQVPQDRVDIHQLFWIHDQILIKANKYPAT